MSSDPSPLSSSPRLLTLPRLVATSAAAVALLLLMLRPPWLPSDCVAAAALIVVVIGLWASAVLPEYLTALIFFIGAMLLKVAPPQVVFSGFASPAWWLVLGGLLIGVSVRRTGLGQRLARRFTRGAAAGYIGVIAGMMVVSLLLGFLMPSALGRSVLLVPIALALGEQHGFTIGSNGRAGLVTAAAFGSYSPTFAILPSNVPNMVLLGSASTLYGRAPGYGEYLLLHFPVLGLLKAVAITLLIVVMFPDRPGQQVVETTSPGAMTRAERLLALALAATLVLWGTDFLHHISPGWIALGAGIFCLLPPVGILPRSAFSEDINFGSLFFVAGVLGVGAVVAHSRLGEVLAKGLLDVLPFQKGANLRNLSALVAGAMCLGPLTTTPGVPALLTPLAAKVAAMTGLPLKSVLMSEVLGFSTTLLPYQAPPLVVAFELGGEPIGKAIRFCLALAAVTVVVLLPLDLLWWHLLGWL
jgi:di/tricarboxylate transporter